MQTQVDPQRNASQSTRRPTFRPCREDNLRKSLTRSRWRARISAGRVAELEAQLERSRASLERHRADARAAEAELLELAPGALANITDVSHGAVSR